MIGAVITIKQARGEWVEVKLVRENHYEYKTPDWQESDTHEMVWEQGLYSKGTNQLSLL